MLALSYLSVDLLSLEQLWAPQPLRAFASKPLDTGGKVVAPVQASPLELDVPERTLCSVGLSLWRKL